MIYYSISILIANHKEINKLEHSREYQRSPRDASKEQEKVKRGTDKRRIETTGDPALKSAFVDAQKWLSPNNLELPEENIRAVIKDKPTGFGSLTAQKAYQDASVSNTTDVLVCDEHKATDVSSEDVLKHILDKAKPVLPDGVEEHLKVLESYHQKGAENKPSDTEYIEAYKQALEKWCPEIWHEEYTKNRSIEFVVYNRWDYAKPKDKDGEWKFYLPLETAYPKDTLLRGIDETLTLKYDDLLRYKQDFDADLKTRVNITARTFEMNMELGSIGWEVTKEYPLAYQHKEDYKEGIRQALIEKKRTKAPLKDMLKQVGYQYAREKLLERSKPNGDVPENFLNTLPGSYFEEWDRFTKMERQVQLKEPIQLDKSIVINGSIEINQDNTILSMKKSVKMGTNESTILVKFLEARTREGGKESTLKAVVLPNKEIWVLPYYFSGKEKAKHSIAGMGEPCVWAGEVDIVGGKVTQLKGDSGHYRNYSSDLEKQKAIFQFAVSAFRDQNYDTSGLEDVSVMGLRHANQTKNEREYKPSSE